MGRSSFGASSLHASEGDGAWAGRRRTGAPSPPARTPRPPQPFHRRLLPLLRRPLLLRKPLHLLQVSGLLASQVTGQGCDGREAEEVEDGDLPAQGLLELLVRPDDQQRVASQVEEVVVQADAGDAQEVAIDVRDDPLQGALRLGIGDAFRSGLGRLGKGAAVDLATRGERQGGDRDEDGRDHRFRETVAQEGP